MWSRCFPVEVHEIRNGRTNRPRPGTNLERRIIVLNLMEIFRARAACKVVESVLSPVEDLLGILFGDMLIATIDLQFTTI